jgi:Ca2+-binding RTX toxin-like protein
MAVTLSIAKTTMLDMMFKQAFTYNPTPTPTISSTWQPQTSNVVSTPSLDTTGKIATTPTSPYSNILNGLLSNYKNPYAADYINPLTMPEAPNLTNIKKTFDYNSTSADLLALANSTPKSLGLAVGVVLTGTDVANKLNRLAGNDTLIGGLGKDSLTGGVGADVFKFNSVSDSSALPKQSDIITDFKHAQGDKIDLSAIDANSVLAGDQAFILISAATFSANATGQLRFDPKTSTLYGSTNSDASPEFAIVLSGVKSLVAGDLVL